MTSAGSALRFLSFLAVLILIATLAASAAPLGSLSGRVTDATGAVVVNGTVSLAPAAGGRAVVTQTDSNGDYRFTAIQPGAYDLTVQWDGLGKVVERLDIASAPITFDVVLRPRALAQEVAVSAEQIVSGPEMARRIPGTVDVLDPKTLADSRVLNANEALRKVPGINVREEEGFGLRPNIGIRGLNPTRSTKVLLLEDGIPLAYAPYGDNASYYHPPIERFTSIEVLKGSGQIPYGPSTVGGVINYLTPDPPQKLSGSITLLGGNLNYFDGLARVGGTFGRFGFLADYMRKQGEGARENLRSGIDDVSFKGIVTLSQNQTLAFRSSFYHEDSNVTYSGLRLSEYLANPRQNPFRNDFFFGKRLGMSVTHNYIFPKGALLTTNFYGSIFDRDWWRQSSNSGQRPNDAADPACGGMANLNTTCGNEGRLRTYYNAGVEPKLRFFHKLFGVRSETDLGFRAHFEIQDRNQKNGPLPTSRDGVLVEDNERRTAAYSFFVQNRFLFNKWTVTPGVRVERVAFERTNRLTGANGQRDLVQVVPGIGVAYSPRADLTFYAGVHRGFAPPRAEDVVSNTGGTIDLDPELSWNYEVGARTEAIRGLRLDATFFRMDYENQIVPASLAGGVGAALTNGGETLHQGAELYLRFDSTAVTESRHNFYLRANYTWLPVAEFTGVRFSSVSGFGAVSVTGNRLPYAPESMLTTSVGYSHPSGWDNFIEAVYVGSQFGDDLNTIASTADGQRGLIPGFVVWNATVNYHIESRHTTLFATVKNLFDRTYLVDRSRGMVPGNPRMVQSGIKFTF